MKNDSELFRISNYVFSKNSGSVSSNKLLRRMEYNVKEMSEHLSESELKRIQEFAETPMYEREPEQLLPEDETAGE